MNVPFFPFRIFLCHASDDKDAAAEITAALEGEGHEVFLDQDDLSTGDPFAGPIRRALRHAHLFIFLISPSSVEHGRYTLSELELARDRWKSSRGRILPVMLRETPIEQLPPFLRTLHILDPKGNLIAELSQKVAVMADRRCRTIYAGISAVLLLAAVAFWFLKPEQAKVTTPEEKPEPALVCTPVLVVGTPEVDDWSVTVPGSAHSMEGCPNIDRIRWTWNDGDTDDRSFPGRHTYRAAGEVAFSVEVVDAQGNSNSATKTLVLEPKAVPEPVTVPEPEPEEPKPDCKPILALQRAEVEGLTATVKGNTRSLEGCPAIASIEWDWGDGTTSESNFPARHEYPRSGTFTARATARDAEQNVASKPISISIPELPRVCTVHRIEEDDAVLFESFGLSVSIGEVEDEFAKEIVVRVSRTDEIVLDQEELRRAAMRSFKAGDNSYDLVLKELKDHRSFWKDDHAMVELCSPSG